MQDDNYEYYSSVILSAYEFSDVNGDGFEDMLIFSGACAKLSAASAGQYQASECLVNGFTPESAGWDAEKNPRLITDANGDGVSDILGFASDGVRFSRGLSKSPNQILSLKTDLTESSITYGSLVDSGAYQKGTGSIFPVMDVQVPYQVVTALTNPDGLGGVRKTQYRYGGLRSHFDYGSLGFQWVETMDPATGALEYNEFKQAFPLAGSLYRSQKQRCSGVSQVPWTGCEVLSQEVSDWQSSETGATADRKVYQPYIRQTAENNWVKSSQ